MPHARGWRLAGAIALASALGLASQSSAGAAANPDLGPATARHSTVRWHACEGGQCATLTVPLDYAHPEDGHTIKVALFRVPARDPRHRIGSLLLNPGGPGASGVDFVRNSAFAFPNRLRNLFDLVGFDPRGAGQTIPVQCRTWLDDVFALDYSPDTPTERTELDTATQRLAQDCEKRNAKYLPYISTQSTVRDLDRIRAALGDRKLTYLGFSYGTYIGSLYADLFPDRVRAMVLDGAVDPELGALDSSIQQSTGFEHALDAFFADCAVRRRCALYNHGDPGAAYDELAQRIDANPVRGGGGRKLGPGEFDTGVASALYEGAASYDRLEEALAAAGDGDGAPMLALSDEYTGRRSDGTYDNSQSAYWAISCLDGPTLPTPEAYQAGEAAARAAAPRLGVSNLNYNLICGYWPVPPVASPNPLDAPGAPPILVIGTTGDPATPVQWAQSLAGELSSGVLLTVEGTQHTSFLEFNPCVDRIVIRSLVHLVPPRNGKMCAAR
jgi:pimeloyl-ACP methyl ester carboxylesterase